MEIFPLQQPKPPTSLPRHISQVNSELSRDGSHHQFRSHFTSGVRSAVTAVRKYYQYSSALSPHSALSGLQVFIFRDLNLLSTTQR